MRRVAFILLYPFVKRVDYRQSAYYSGQIELPVVGVLAYIHENEAEDGWDWSW